MFNLAFPFALKQRDPWASKRPADLLVEVKNHLAFLNTGCPVERFCWLVYWLVGWLVGWLTSCPCFKSSFYPSGQVENA